MNKTESKKDIVERMAKDFIALETTRDKNIVALIIMAYDMGKKSGKIEEREKWFERAMTAMFS